MRAYYEARKREYNKRWDFGEKLFQISRRRFGGRMELPARLVGAVMELMSGLFCLVVVDFSYFTLQKYLTDWIGPTAFAFPRVVLLACGVA